MAKQNQMEEKNTPKHHPLKGQTRLLCVIYRSLILNITFINTQHKHQLYKLTGCIFCTITATFGYVGDTFSTKANYSK